MIVNIAPLPRRPALQRTKSQPLSRTRSSDYSRMSIVQFSDSQLVAHLADVTRVDQALRGGSTLV